MSCLNVRRALAHVILAGILLGASSLDRAVASEGIPSVAVARSVKAFLRSSLERNDQVDRTARVWLAVVHLSSDGRRQVVAHIEGARLCASGGCATLVLNPAGKSFQVVGNLTQGWPPISVLPGKTNGWHDLGVWVHGGGILQGYEVALPFNGTAYFRNPTVPPARRLVGHVKERVVISGREPGEPLFE
jgi:hypothetical protein